MRQQDIADPSLGKSQIDINTMLLGTITAIKGDLCTVRLSNKRNFGGSVSDQADLLEVPLVYPSVGGFAITLPILKYLPVPCMVLFSQRSIDNRMNSGGEQHPEDDRMHDLSDATAMPCMDWNRITDLNGDNLEIRSRVGGGKIEMSDGGKFRITNGTFDLLRLLEDTLTALETTKAKVATGSSSGNWDIDTQSTFSAIKAKLNGIML